MQNSESGSDTGAANAPTPGIWIGMGIGNDKEFKTSYSEKE
jgi:hypothetical protein